MSDAAAGFCAQCGAHLEVGARFCSVCGHAVGAPVAPAGAVPGGLPPSLHQVGHPHHTGRVVAVAVGIGVVLVAAAVVAAVLLTRRNPVPADQVALEPVGLATPNPFTDSVAVGPELAVAASVVRVPVPAGPQSTAGQNVNGSTPALYGGSGNNAVCDRERLIAFLQANPAKAAAWAGVVGVQTTSIGDYVRSLTPVLLTRDTRVTNHGFADGRATTVPAVLQAGTAVLVDRYGVPRVKCACGNPLGEPTPVTASTTFVGPRWVGFSPTTVVVVNVAVQVDTFVIVDVADGSLIARPAGTAGADDRPVGAEDTCRLFPADPACATTTTTAPPTTTTTTTTTTTSPPLPAPTAAPTTTEVVDRGVEPADVVRQAFTRCGRGGTLTVTGETPTGGSTYLVQASIDVQLGIVYTTYEVDMDTLALRATSPDGAYFVCLGNTPPDL